MNAEGLEKILAKVHLWATRNISFARRAQLINIIIFGMFNYWASIFMLPSEVLDSITKICRSYLWGGGSADSSKIPSISWQNSYRPKAYGGLGLKDFKLWNKITIAKLVWAISMKKDTLWMRWIHGRYIKEQIWWDYNPKPDCSWYWKKICQIKEDMKQASSNQKLLEWRRGQPYKVTLGYKWQLQLKGKAP